MTGDRQDTHSRVDGGRERQIAVYRERLAQQLEAHKGRIDKGLQPVCGLRLMVPGSAVVIPDIHPWMGETPFAQFSLDSRDPALYAMAADCASELVEYARSALSKAKTEKAGGEGAGHE